MTALSRRRPRKAWADDVNFLATIPALFRARTEAAVTKTDDELFHENLRMGPIAPGPESLPDLDFALWRAARLGGPQRLIVRGNTTILGDTVESDQVARLIARSAPR